MSKAQAEGLPPTGGEQSNKNRTATGKNDSVFKYIWGQSRCHKWCEKLVYPSSQLNLKTVVPVNVVGNRKLD